MKTKDTGNWRNRPRGTIGDRFNDKWICSMGGCFEWLGATDLNKRGQMRIAGVNKRATHVAWFLKTGEWPELHVLHTCDNPACVRFDHLFLGTQNDNIQDCIKKGRKWVARGENHPKARLSRDDVLFIRSRPIEKGYIARMARMFFCTSQNISDIVNNRTWKELA